MKQIAINALDYVMADIKNYSTQLRHSIDEYSLFYWDLRLKQALASKARIEKRFNVRHNVVFVDFQSKKRVA